MRSNRRKSPISNSLKIFLISTVTRSALILLGSSALLPLDGRANLTGKALEINPDQRIVYLKSIDLPDGQWINVNTDLIQLNAEHFLAITIRGQKVFFQEGGTQFKEGYGFNPLGWGNTVKAKWRSEYFAKHQIKKSVFDLHIDQWAAREYGRSVQLTVLDNFAFFLARSETAAASYAATVRDLHANMSQGTPPSLIVVPVENSTMLNNVAHRLHLFFNELRKAQK